TPRRGRDPRPRRRQAFSADSRTALRRSQRRSASRALVPEALVSRPSRHLAVDKEPRFGSKLIAGRSPGTLSFIWPQDPKARRSRHRGPAEKMTTTFCGCVARLGRSTSDGSVVHASQRRGELRTRAHAELAKNAAEMRLDRAQGNEQRLCDLAVAEAFRGHCRDPVLARG